MITKQDRAQFLALIITRQKLFLGVGAAEIDPSRLHAEISDKVQPQIEHLRPEIRDLFVANSFFAGHVRSRNQALRSRVLPMRLAAHSTHDAIGIKCQISNGKNSFLLCFEIFCDRRAVRAGQRRIADEIEVWFGAASDYGQSGRNAVPTFRLDISQHRLAFETIQALADQHRDAVLRIIIGQPRSGLGIQIAIQQVSVAMHHAHLQFHHPKTRRCLARQQSAANHHHSLFNVGHFAQRQRVAHAAEVNHVPEVHACDRRSHRPAAHRQTGFREFNAFAISQYRQTPLDVELLYDRGESCFDFVGIEPALVEVGEFFERRRFFAQKIFRKQPAIVGWHDLRADDGNRAALVMLAHAFARARPANTAAND